MAADLLHVLEANGSYRPMAPEVAGTLNGGFTEVCEARFPCLGNDWQLFVDDAPLPVVRLDEGEYWLWKPSFYAGTVRAELIKAGERHGVGYLFDVSPDPQKVGQTYFQKMVEAVWDFDPSLVVGDQAASTSIGTHGDRENLAVRYMRFVKYADALASSTSAISRNPHQTLRSARRHVPLHLIRATDLQTVRAAMASDAACILLDGSNEDEIRGPRPDLVFDVPVSEQSFDSAANRTMAALISQVVQAAHDLARRLHAQCEGETDDDSRQALAQRLSKRLQVLAELTDSVSDALCQLPFSCVTRKEVTSSGLTAIAAHPLYARAQQVTWMILRPGYEGTRLWESSSMSPTWGIFEAWCFAKLATILQRQYSNWQWTRSTPGPRRLRLRGALGPKSITLHFQQPFSYTSDPPPSGFWSVSMQLVPDIVVEVSDGIRSAWIVLDAKYRRTRRNVLDGMRSAHIYRDALRRFSAPPAMSLILIPADAEGASWILDSSYRNTHRVGALAFSEAALDTAPIEAWIDAHLQLS